MASEEPVYRIHSLVRKVQTKIQRHKASRHHRFVQRLGGGAITVRRARAAMVPVSLLRRHLTEIRQAVSEGKIEVRTAERKLVDIFSEDFQPLKSVVSVASPKPQTQPDSAAKDKSFEHGVGQAMPMFADGFVAGQAVAPPALLGSLLDEDAKPIQAPGDPVRARAAQAVAEESEEEDEDDFEDDSDEDLDDEDEEGSAA